MWLWNMQWVNVWHVVLAGDHSVWTAANCLAATLLTAVPILQWCSSNKCFVPNSGVVLLPCRQEPWHLAAGTQLCSACQLHRGRLRRQLIISAQATIPSVAFIDADMLAALSPFGDSKINHMMYWLHIFDLKQHNVYLQKCCNIISSHSMCRIRLCFTCVDWQVLQHLDTAAPHSVEDVSDVEWRCISALLILWPVTTAHLSVTSTAHLLSLNFESSLFLFYCRTMQCISGSAAYAIMRCVCVCVCVSVCLSHLWVVSKRIKTSSKFFHRRAATPF